VGPVLAALGTIPHRLASARPRTRIMAYALALAFASGSPAAEAPALRGRVVDLASGQAIAGATVTGSGLASAVTNRRGEFICALTGEPVSTVEVQAAGYLPRTLQADGWTGEHALEIALERAPSYSEELVVAAASSASTEPSHTVEARTVATAPGAMEDGLQALTALPGVVSRDGWTGRLYVRGGRPDQNGVYLDGVPVYDPYRLFGLTSIFNPEMLATMTLFPGGFDAKYGDRLSAAIAGDNRVGTTDRVLAGSASISTTNANVRAEGRLGLGVPSSWLVSFRRTYFDLVAADASVPRFADLQARLLLEPSPADRVTVTVLGSREDSNLAIDEREFEDVPESHTDVGDNQRDVVVAVQGRHLLGQRLRLFYIASHTTDRQTSDVFYREGETGFETRLAQDLSASATTLRAWVEGQLGRHTLEAGGEAARSDSRVTFRIDTDDPRIDIPESLTRFANRQDYARFGAFTQDTMALATALDLKVGVRWDRSELSGLGVTSPRAALAWRVGPGWEVHAAWGQYHQSPSYESLQGDGYFLDLRGIKDLHLRPEHAEHALASVAFASERGWKVAVDVYSKRFSDLLASGEEDETILVLGADDQAHPYTRESLTWIPENSRRGYARGAQLVLTLLEGRRRPFYGMLAYTFGQVRSRDATTWRWEDYDQRHNVILIGGWKLGRGWQLGWRWQFASGFPYTPVQNVIRVVDDRDHDGIYDPAAGDTFTYQRDEPDTIVNSRRLPPYHRLDLRVEYTRLGDGLDWTFYLDVINSYARENTEEYLYNADYTKRTSFNGLPLLPSLGVRASF